MKQNNSKNSCIKKFCCKSVNNTWTYTILAVLSTSLVFLTYRCSERVTEIVVQSRLLKQQPSKFAHMPDFIKDLFNVIEEEKTESMEISQNKQKCTTIFDPVLLSKSFEMCATSVHRDKVDMDAYLSAWDELNKFLQSMGKAFSFVSSDVTDKIGIMKEYRKGPDAENYQTIENMIQFEKNKGLINYKYAPSKNVKASGTRTLLRLHRALKFLSLLFDKLAKNSDGGKVSSMGYNAYHASPMAKYHPWLVQKAVGVAVYLLPDREQFFKQMCQEIDNEKITEYLNETAESMDAIFEYTHAMYSSHKVLEIP